MPGSPARQPRWGRVPRREARHQRQLAAGWRGPQRGSRVGVPWGPAASAKKMTRLLALVVAAALSLPLAAHEQPAQPPTFRSTADIVEVDVVVQDKSGRFVADLRPADFEVREEGDAQKIELFYLVRENSITTTGDG